MSQQTAVFDVAGMDCADCARSVERVVAALPGVESAAVNFGTGTLTVLASGTAAERSALSLAVGGAVDRAGYAAAMRSGGMPGRSHAAPIWRNRKLLPAAVAGALWLAGFMLLHGWEQRVASTTVFAMAIAIGGWPILRAALASLRARRLDMNALMSISVIGAAILGDWSEGALVVVLFSLGSALQAVTFDRTRGAIRSLLDQSPEKARLQRDSGDVMVGIDALVPGDVVRVLPGERLPADGTVLEGASELGMAAITGESVPVPRTVGDDVFAGSLNGQGSLQIRVSKPASESMLAQIVHLVEEAQGSKAPSQQLVDRFASIYTPIVVLLAASIVLAGIAFTSDAGTWVYRALVLLVIACPCALVISTPVSIVSAIGAATRGGVLIKGGAALEDLARVRTVAFDKTGTLTAGRPSVIGITTRNGHTSQHVLGLAAAVESHSEHPLARAIVSRAMHDQIEIPMASGFQATVGVGATASIDGHHVAVGGDRLVAQTGLSSDDVRTFDEQANRLAARAYTVLAVIETDGDRSRLLGTLTVADQVKPNLRANLARLREAGLERQIMLSGDRLAVAQAIAAQSGIDDVRADLLPADKAALIAELHAHGPVAMVGDGVNDAPALANATVGIAMGVGGTDVALDSADIVLMRDDLGALAPTVTLAHRTLSTIRQNVTISMVTKVLALVLAAFGFVTLWIAVLVDVGTSLLVTANGLRLARQAGLTHAGVATSASSVPIAADEANARALHHEACGTSACGCGSDHEHEVQNQVDRAADQAVA